MRTSLIAIVFFFSFFDSFSQNAKVLPKKYPSLLWQITGNGLTKPSYLFGTMHVSSKMVFHLSDSFYLGIKNADVVALETNPGQWQEDFSRYDLDGQSIYNYARWKKGVSAPQDYFTINTLQFYPYIKLIEAALYSSPSMINSFLYRSNSERTSDFEEDTYLDLHIYQVGKKWGKKLCGVENFDQSMQLMKEAYSDAAKEKNTKQKSNDYDDDFSYSKLEDAYRAGNLDLLDTINKVNSMSAAFDEKFLYKRNEIQAHSIDSILKTKASLFVGVGAAHLPGQRGVIELLRSKGYKLRPVQITERDGRQKEEIEKIRVPVQFSRQTSDDGFFSVNLPGKLYSFSKSVGGISQQQYADMSNGSYYMVTRINTNASLWGHSAGVVKREIDSVLYENIPGKIITRKVIVKNGYQGFEITNRTRHGDFQRYNIFITPFEVILFKMSGTGDYVKDGTEADQFFNSIELRRYTNEWKKYSPSFGGFEAEMPHLPYVVNEGNWQFMSVDNETGTSFEVIRTDIHNYDFAEEDSFDLNLMEESFACSEFINKQVSRRQTIFKRYPALEVKYKYKDGSVVLVKFLIQGPHYYTLVTHGKTENEKMYLFLNSFTILPFDYSVPVKQTDTTLHFTVNSPVQLEKPKKLQMYPDNIYNNQDDEIFLEENGTYLSKLVENDSAGEKIYVSFYRPGRYYYNDDTTKIDDTTHFKTEKENWIYRSRRKYVLPNKLKVFEYELGDPKSSRCVRGKLYSKDGINYRLETETDTLSVQSSFITNFFKSFLPVDTIKGIDIKAKKSGLFFADFFSNDSLLHKRAVKNIDRLNFDSSDLGQLKKAIQSLTWKEKKYIDVKKDFISSFVSVKNNQASDYLKEIYYAAGDTIEFQYTALKTLLQQETSYSYQVFKTIMASDPPVLDLNGVQYSSYTPARRRNIFKISGVQNTDNDYTGNYSNTGNSFLKSLYDSLKLTAGIFKDILPLINIHDYEQPIMNLMGTLVDSNLIAAKDYDNYEPKFLLEAKQQLKKQMISEKNRSIEKAQQDKDDNNNANEAKDYGNNQLSLYATLLMPFDDKNPAILQLINQLLGSSDKRLKYNTMLLLLRNKKQLPDTLLTYFASSNEFRYQLYVDLKEDNLAALFPAAYNNHTALAESELISISGYDVPDTIAFVDKLAVKQKERSGFVYFFKLKQKKDDNAWKLASVGILPANPKQFEFEKKEKLHDEAAYDFTEITTQKFIAGEPVKVQLQKALKKLQYSKRNSAAQFYASENSMNRRLFR